MAEKIQADLVLQLINPCRKLGRKAGTSAGRKAAEVMTEPRRWGLGWRREARRNKNQEVAVAAKDGNNRDRVKGPVRETSNLRSFFWRN